MGGVFFAVYTQGFGAQDAPIDVAFDHISDHFDGHYFTGERPPVSIWATPFTAVLDLDDMVVVNKDMISEEYMMSVDDVLAAVEEAAAD
jgi:hypothetical protein